MRKLKVVKRNLVRSPLGGHRLADVDGYVLDADRRATRVAAPGG